MRNRRSAPRYAFAPAALFALLGPAAAWGQTADRPSDAREAGLDAAVIEALGEAVARAWPALPDDTRVAFPDLAFGDRALHEGLARAIEGAHDVELVAGPELDDTLAARKFRLRSLDALADGELDAARRAELAAWFGAALLGEVRAWRRALPWRRELVVRLRLVSVDEGAFLLDRTFEVARTDAALLRRLAIGAGATLTLLVAGAVAVAIAVRRRRPPEPEAFGPETMPNAEALACIERAEDRLRDAMAAAEESGQEVLVVFLRGGQRRHAELADTVRTACDQYGARRVCEAMDAAFVATTERLAAAAEAVRDAVRAQRPDAVNRALEDLGALATEALERFGDEAPAGGPAPRAGQ